MKIAKKYFTLFAFVLFAFNANGQQHFNNSITVPDDLPAAVMESVNDLAYWLQKSTGNSFKINTAKPGKGRGIQLVWWSKADLPSTVQQQLKNDGQSFYLIMEGDAEAQIIGTGKESFNNGIYTFLNELGFRWYMPGDNWARVPKLSESRKKISKVFTPSFLSRSYFGTGGIGPIPGLDDNNTFKKDFDDWNRRNRLNTEFDGKGHVGQVFFNENKDILNKNPSYFCNNTVNKYGRIDVSNARAVDLFVKWALGKINYEDKYPMVGVDPADGSGGKDDCLPKGMKNVSTYSDKYFYLANAVARQLESDKTGARVQLYAYATHAEPPSFEVHPRVYPIIIPYAFQRVTEPGEFIAMWSKKLGGRPMGIYDYWNITQWSVCLPQFNIYIIPERLKLWKKSNIDFVRIESTNAKGPMGHTWWLAAQLMWDVDQSFETLYKEFLENNFGAGAADVRNMYDRWSLNYQDAMEAGFCMNDLERAASKVSDADAKKRINELKAYAIYLEKYYKYTGNPTSAQYNELIQYINSIHHLRLLQTRPLQVLYIKPPAGYVKSGIEMKVEKKNTGVQKLSESEIEKKFVQARSVTPPLYKISDFQFDIKRATPAVSPGKYYGPLYINGTNTYRFYLPAKRKLVFQVGATEDSRYSIKDQQGKKVHEGMVKKSGKTGYVPVTIELPAGVYTLQFGELYRFSRFIFPQDIVLISDDTFYDNFKYPLQYFYVPKGVDEIVLKDNIVSKKGSFIISPGGQKITPEKVKTNIFRVKVPKGQDGKVWILNMAHRSYKILNFPSMLSLNPFDYKE